MHRFKQFLVISFLTVIGSIEIAGADTVSPDITIEGSKVTTGQSIGPIGKDAIPPRGDPDTIYQRGKPAAKASGARINQDQSRLYFDRLHRAKGLDTAAPFVYRGYMLNFVSAGSSSGSPPHTYLDVVCSVRGRAR